MAHWDQKQLPSGDEDDFSPESTASPTPLEWGLLALGSLRRRWVLPAVMFAAVLTATTGLYLRKTPLYRAEAKVLAQRSQGLPTAVRSTFDEMPTRTAWEVVHQRENLIAIIRQTKLLETTPKPAQEKPAWHKWLPWPRSTAATKSEQPLAGGGSKDAALDALVLALDRNLMVVVGDDGTISLQLDWPDPEQGHAIISAALQNFLEARHVQEVAAIDDVITVLEGRTALLRANLEKLIEQTRRRASQPGAVPSAPRPRQPSEELLRLQSTLQSKQRAIQDVEDFRRRRLSDLQAQLDQSRTMLSDAHPTVIGLRKDLETLSRESPQVNALRDEERQLRRDLAARLEREDYPSTARVQAPVVAIPAQPDEDPAVRDARVQYEQMAARTTAAQVELDAARAAFKYRYNIVWPPQVGKDPVSPKPKKIFAAGGFAALILAVLTAVGPDLLSGRIFERWQVERNLGLQVVGDVRRDA